MKKNVVVLLIVSSVGILGYFVYRGFEKHRAKDWRAESQPQHESKQLSQEDRVEEKHTPSRAMPVRSRKHQEAEFHLFQESFGSHLKADFIDDSRVYRIRGDIGQGESASPSYKPNDEARVRARASEVLSQARGLLSLSSQSPVEIAKVNLGEISAQVYFKQMFQAYRVIPNGNLKIDLGPRGELISLESSYVPDFEMKNNQVFNQDLSLQSLIKFLSSIDKALNEKSQPIPERVVWVQAKKAYYSYQYIIAGMIIVIDSESGEVLFSKETKKE